MVRFGVGLLAIGAFACLSPTSADAQRRSALNCESITRANAARCCRIVTITRHNVDVCTRRARAITRSRAATSATSAHAPFFQSNIVKTGEQPCVGCGQEGQGPTGSNANPAGRFVPGGGQGILAPNIGGDTGRLGPTGLSPTGPAGPGGVSASGLGGLGHK